MRCPHGVLAVSLDDEIGGHRLTPSKCCGSWTTVERWPVDPDAFAAEIRAEAHNIVRRHRERLLPPVKCERPDGGCSWVGTAATTSEVDGCHYCPACGYSVNVPREARPARPRSRR